MLDIGDKSTKEKTQIKLDLNRQRHFHIRNILLDILSHQEVNLPFYPRFNMVKQVEMIKLNYPTVYKITNQPFDHDVKSNLTNI